MVEGPSCIEPFTLWGAGKAKDPLSRPSLTSGVRRKKGERILSLVFLLFVCEFQLPLVINDVHEGEVRVGISMGDSKDCDCRFRPEFSVDKGRQASLLQTLPGGEKVRFEGDENYHYRLNPMSW
jgi:hypothetical protein